MMSLTVLQLGSGREEADVDGSPSVSTGGSDGLTRM